MGGIAWCAFQHLATNNFTRFFRVIIFCSFYGVFDEWHQSFVPGRNSDVFDWLADTMGGVFAAGIAWKIRNISDRLTSRP